MDNMDALTERVLRERLRQVNAKLDKAIEQRDRFAKSFHETIRLPFQERHEILTELDDEITRAGEDRHDD